MARPRQPGTGRRRSGRSCNAALRSCRSREWLARAAGRARFRRSPDRFVARIIHAGDTPAKRRRAHTRASAEALRLLAQRPGLAAGVFDAEAKDLAAFLALHLRGIGETIEDAAQSWDDRNYWRKAEKLRADYRWAPQAADAIEALILDDDWDAVVSALLELVPRFSDVNISRMTRDADHWVGAHRALVRRASKTA